MMNIKKSSIFPWYSSDENKKENIHYMSFKSLFLILYIIGLYYVILNNSLEHGNLEIVKNCNVYERILGDAEKNHNGPKRKKNLKHKKEDVNKTKHNTNNIKCNEQKVKENKYNTSNDNKNTNVENKSNSSINNINYNDMSKNLTEKELLDLLNSLEECPSKEDLRNIWNHTVSVAKEGFDDIQKELRASIQKYLDNDIYRYDAMGNKEFLYDHLWKENISRFYRTVGTEVVEFTNKFFSLINDKHTLDDVLKFIYSFMEYFKTLKNELRETHQKELLQKIEGNVHKKKK
ncbi:Plasmodium exported protein (PHISTa), unknown, putative [Plasmodium sp.]|nr:Plasmodium exported protein (PHISTa), unknown, putative [Plasmodium sp.]